MPNVNAEKRPGDYPDYPYYVSSEDVADQNQPIEESPISTEKHEGSIPDTPEKDNSDSDDPNDLEEKKSPKP